MEFRIQVDIIWCGDLAAQCTVGHQPSAGRVKRGNTSLAGAGHCAAYTPPNHRAHYLSWRTIANRAVN